MRLAGAQTRRSRQSTGHRHPAAIQGNRGSKGPVRSKGGPSREQPLLQARKGPRGQHRMPEWRQRRRPPHLTSGLPAPLTAAAAPSEPSPSAALRMPRRRQATPLHRRVTARMRSGERRLSPAVPGPPHSGCGVLSVQDFFCRSFQQLCNCLLCLLTPPTLPLLPPPPLGLVVEIIPNLQPDRPLVLMLNMQ